MIGLISELLTPGIIDRSGRFAADLRHARIRKDRDEWVCVLVTADRAAAGAGIVFTGYDLKNLICSKGAVYAGFISLLKEAGLDFSAVERILISGGFSQYLDIEKAVHIGLLPDIDRAKFRYLGNSSIVGTHLALLSDAQRREVREICHSMTCIDFSSNPWFHGRVHLGLVPAPHPPGDVSRHGPAPRQGRGDEAFALLGVRHDACLALIVLFTLLGSICSVGIAGLLLLFRGKHLSFLTGVLIPYAIGTLLGAAFFGMIPHALLPLASTSVMSAVLFGIILFYILEKFALWPHCHEEPCEVHTRAGTRILIGDTLHDFVDGVAIAAAFAEPVPLMYRCGRGTRDCRSWSYR